MKQPERLIANKYQLQRLIGRGGMGEVYQAVNIAVQRQVAVKLLRPHLAENPEKTERFQREIAALARVQHDHVCDLLDTGVTDEGRHFFVMPLLRGQSLAELLENEPLLSVSRAVDIAVQVLSALDAAHQQGLIHRDLKPKNILLTRVGDREDFVKILDFGIAKLQSEVAARPQQELTRTGIVLGTPLYMAPEQAANNRRLDERVDLFALGIILYEMLTGRLPFEGQSAYEVMWNLANSPVAPPSAHRSEVTPALEQVVLKALARNRAERYASATETMTALAAACPDLCERRHPAPKSTDPPAATTAVTAVTAATEVTQTAESVPNSPPPETPATPLPMAAPRHARQRWVVVAAGGMLLAGIGLALWGTTPSRPEAPAVDQPGDSRTRTDDEALRALIGQSPPAQATPRAPGHPNDAPNDAPGHPKNPPTPPTPPGQPRAAPQQHPTPEGVRAGAADSTAGRPVNITLKGVPPGATVLVNGKAVKGETFELPPTDRTVAIAVRRQGRTVWSHNLVARQDTTLAVELPPPRTARRPRRPTRRRRPRQPATPAPNEASPNQEPAPTPSPPDLLPGAVPNFGDLP